jgi:hypothetical protein
MAAAVLACLALPAVASAQQPPGTASPLVSVTGFIPEPGVISARFRDGLMYVSSTSGLSIYDVGAPAAPRRVGRLDLPNWENEDIDVGGGIALISNDPSVGAGRLHVIDVSDPASPSLLSSFDTGSAFPTGGFGPIGRGTGHTASCVQDCRYAYLAGTLSGIDIVDLTDPSAPKYADPANFPATEATGGLATHDVQFDQAGLAWVTGAGGTAAYDVSDPTHPVLVHRTNEQGDSRYDETLGADDGSTYNDFVHHNSMRLRNASLASLPAGADPAADSNVVLVTEEDYNRPTCRGAGSFESWAIGAGGILAPLDKWDVEIDPSRQSLCSAHYFDERAGLVAQGWYEQGVRFLDVSNPADIRQVGFWIPAKTLMWGALYPPTDPSGEVVYALDNTRGIDILRFDRPGPGEPAPPTVAAPTAAAGGSGAGTPSAGGPAVRPNVAVRISDRRTRVRAGARVTYRVVVRSTTAAAVRGVRVVVDLSRALLPARTRGATRRGRRLTVRVGKLGPRASRTLAFRARVRRGPRTALVRAAVTAAEDANPRDDRAADRNRITVRRRSRPRAALAGAGYARATQAQRDRAAHDHALARRNARLSSVASPEVDPQLLRAVRSAYGWACRLVA